MFCVNSACRGLGYFAKTGSIILSVSFLGGCGMNSLNLFDPGPNPAGDAQITTGSITPSRRPSAMRAVYVQPGDTLHTVAQENNSTPSQIVTANGLKPPYNLNIGQKLLVPGRNPASNPAPMQAQARSSSTNYVTVGRGDTLYSIARANNVRVEDLAATNQIAPPYQVAAGRKLRLPSSQSIVTGSISKPQATSTASQAPLRKVELPPVNPVQKKGKRDQIYYFHKVAAGDTMPSIATHYKVDLNTLAKFNRLDTSAPLKTGQIVKVPM